MKRKLEEPRENPTQTPFRPSGRRELGTAARDGRRASNRLGYGAAPDY